MTSLSPWAAALVLLLAACAAPAPAPLAPPAPPLRDMPYAQAAVHLADGLLAQLGDAAAGAELVLDPMLESSTGQQTAATQMLERAVADRLAAAGHVTWLPFDAASIAKARYLMTGTLGRAPEGSSAGAMRIDVALTDLRAARVAAHAVALARSEGVDRSPSPYFRDSPVLVKDRGIDGYVRTSAADPGQPADGYYIERVTAAAAVDEATRLYNAGRYAEALARYRSALQAQPGERQMRALNGAYLSLVKLGRAGEAEQAFGKVAAAGIAYRELGVKLLFNPGKTEFWSDPRVSGAYPMWLRQIARESATVKACLTVVGHTSHTGSEEANDSLSLQRANAVRQRLTREAGELAGRVTAAGVGSRENIVGSGTDNVLDALDRRVEFKIVSCDPA